MKTLNWAILWLSSMWLVACSWSEDFKSSEQIRDLTGEKVCAIMPDDTVRRYYINANTSEINGAYILGPDECNYELSSDSINIDNPVCSIDRSTGKSATYGSLESSALNLAQFLYNWKCAHALESIDTI